MQTIFKILNFFKEESQFCRERKFMFCLSLKSVILPLLVLVFGCPKVLAMFLPLL
jgi:hypothetical protein